MDNSSTAAETSAPRVPVSAEWPKDPFSVVLADGKARELRYYVSTLMDWHKNCKVGLQDATRDGGVVVRNIVDLLKEGLRSPAWVNAAGETVAGQLPADVRLPDSENFDPWLVFASSRLAALTGAVQRTLHRDLVDPHAQVKDPNEKTADQKSTGTN